MRTKTGRQFCLTNFVSRNSRLKLFLFQPVVCTFILLLFQKTWRKIDVLGGNLMTSQLLRQFFSVIEAECFIRAFSIQFLSAVRIDVIHHPIDIFLRQLIKTPALRQNSPDKLMPHLNLCLLIRRTGITVVDSRPLKPFPIRSVFDALRIGKLTSVVRLISNSG